MTSASGIAHELFVRVLPIAAVALGVFHVIRGRICDRYQVSTTSMEPAVHGSPQDGDVLLVDKTAWLRRAPRQFDLVVVRNPHAGEPDLVKRVAAVGGDGPGDAARWVRIEGGDLWTGADRDRLTRVRKDPVAHHDLAMTHFAFPGGDPRAYFHADPAWAPAGDVIDLQPAAATLDAVQALQLPAARVERRRADPSDQWLPGHLANQDDVDLTFLDCNGTRLGSRTVNPDFGLEADIAVPAGLRGIVVTYEREGSYYALAYAADGRGRLLVDGTPDGDAFAGPALVAGGVVAFRFGHLDGWFHFVIDGRRLLHRELPRRDPAAGGPRLAPVRRTHRMHLAVAGAAARLTRVRVYHDVSYDVAGSNLGDSLWELNDGDLFLLGDNTRDSRDSRQFGAFPASALLGRPVMVIGPPRRLRFFDR
jgi:hypothetical protein